MKFENKFWNLAHCADPPTTLQQLPIRVASKGCRVILVCKQQVGTQFKVFQNIYLYVYKSEVWTLPLKTYRNNFQNWNYTSQNFFLDWNFLKKNSIVSSVEYFFQFLCKDPRMTFFLKWSLLWLGIKFTG